MLHLKQSIIKCYNKVRADEVRMTIRLRQPVLYPFNVPHSKPFIQTIILTGQSVSQRNVRIPYSAGFMFV